MSSPLRVIKLGGSLLDWPELPHRFRRWLAAQPPAASIVIVGGGPLVDGLRTVDRAHRLPLEASHWLAIRAMSLTAELAAGLLPEAMLIHALDQIQRTADAPPQILDVEPLLRAEQGSATELPSSWDVTSDSITAHVARLLGATEVVLLKSTLPETTSTGGANLSGYVDAYFPIAARGFVVRAVNLRDSAFPEVTFTFADLNVRLQ
jgi:aspartokinase-like uncharacterized kinase